MNSLDLIPQLYSTYVLFEISQSKYLKIFGSLRIYHDIPTISILHIEVVNSIDTITHHWLKVIFIKHELMNRSSLTVMQHTNRTVVPPLETEPTKPSPLIDMTVQNDLWDEVALTQNQQRVLQLIQQYGLRSSEGVSMQALLQNARKIGLSEKEVV